MIVFHTIDREKAIQGRTPNLKFVTGNTHKFDHVQVLSYKKKNIPQTMSEDKQTKQNKTRKSVYNTYQKMS